MKESGGASANDGRRAARYVAGRLIVKLKPSCYSDYAAQRNLLGTLPPNSVLSREFDEMGMGLISLPTGADPLEVAREIEKHEAVEFVEPDYSDSGTDN
jgi:hypothetical protein